MHLKVKAREAAVKERCSKVVMELTLKHCNYDKVEVKLAFFEIFSTYFIVTHFTYIPSRLPTFRPIARI